MEQTKILLDRLKDSETKHKAFECIVKDYSPLLYQQIRRMVTWHEDADDVLQNTFLKAWNSIEGFRGDSSISTWLFRIAYNESLTFLSKKRDFYSLSDVEQTELRSIECDPYFDGNEIQIKLEKALQTLPNKQKAVFCLKYFEEKKYEEISSILNTSVGALKASYHLAIKKIQKYFDECD